MRKLLLLSAITLSATAAYFSIFGLTKLFAGNFIPILIMAVGLEFSKIVSISFLYRQWNKITKLIKIYMSIASIVLILLTSIGIYVFLLSSYQGSKTELIQNQATILDLSNKIDRFNQNINFIDDNIDIISKKYDNIMKNRENQENRLDTLYNRRMYSSTNKIEMIISNYNVESIKLMGDIELYRNNKVLMVDSINALKREIQLINISSDNSDIGPIKYISELIGIDIDIIINYFIFIIIFVFDPMAIIMFIAYNKYVYERELDQNTTIIGSSNDNGDFEISFTNESI